MLLIHSGDDGIGAAHRLVADPDGLGGLDIRQTVVVDDLQNLRLIQTLYGLRPLIVVHQHHTLAPGAQQVIPGQRADNVLVLIQNGVGAETAFQNGVAYIVDVIVQMEAHEVMALADALDGQGVADKMHSPVGIVGRGDDAGVGVMDPATGELTGVIKDYVELAKDCLQGQTLEFDLKGYDTRNEQLQALHTGEIGLIFHVSQNPYSAETNGFVLSDTIWTFNMAATTAKDSFNENAENTVAVTKDNFALKAYI